jgi:hypothetical protein
MAACAVDNLIDALNGNVEKNCVNPQVLNKLSPAETKTRRLSRLFLLWVPRLPRRINRGSPGLRIKRLMLSRQRPNQRIVLAGLLRGRELMPLATKLTCVPC